MIIKEIKFNKVLCASGARGFFGEGYWFHKYVPGLNYSGSTLVTKTTTLYPRKGNLPLYENSIKQKELFPKCIIVKPIDGVVLNAVGLSGPGAKWLLEQNIWQRFEQPFMISFMSVDPNKSLDEYKEFADLLLSTKFNSPFGLEINISCPNVHADLSGFIKNVHKYIDAISTLNCPITVKINVLFSYKVAKEIIDHDNCHGIVCSNTIPYGQMPKQIDWKKLFGPKNPLEKFNGGGLSGKPLLPITKNWISEFRSLHTTNKIIIGCGGILSKEDACDMFRVGADAIALGAVSILRPWRVREIVNTINNEV